jgi:hypothetical protein
MARRREPFANCSDTLVSLELIGENFTILPVTPVLLVVNRSPIWYVYPLSVISFPFVSGGIKLCEPFQFLLRNGLPRYSTGITFCEAVLVVMLRTKLLSNWLVRDNEQPHYRLMY